MTDLVLKNERLTITLSVADPGERDTLRFDTACRVKEIILDGKYSFAVPEQIRPKRITAGGFGLSAEFSVPEDLSTVKSGETFTKPGVGILTQLKDRAPYYIFGDYPVKPFKVLIDHGEDFVSFTELPETTDGTKSEYPLTITKKLALKGNKICIETTVKNEGDKEVSINEYQHNFFSANKKPIGPDYKMILPYAKDITGEEFIFDALDENGVIVGKAESPISWRGKEITWNKNTEGLAIFKELTRDKLIDEGDSVPEYYYELCDTKEGLYVREGGNFFPSKITVWGVEHVMCAENFIDITLSSGESTNYARVWEFGKR